MVNSYYTINTNTVIPDKIAVGFSKGASTQSDLLGIVSYETEKGKYKNNSDFNKLRNASIPIKSFDNTPTKGFKIVTDDNAQGSCYSGRHGQTPCARIVDPRGFDVDLQFEKFLYVMRYMTIGQGGLIENELVYAWDLEHTATLILLPVNAKEYPEIVKYSTTITKDIHIKARDLVVGETYIDKRNIEHVYICKSEKYDYYGDLEGKHFFFYLPQNKSFTSVKALGTKFFKAPSIQSEGLVFEEILEKLHHETAFSPYDATKDKIINVSFEEFKKEIEKFYVTTFYNEFYERVNIQLNHDKKKFTCTRTRKTQSKSHTYEDTLRAIFHTEKPIAKQTYLANGRTFRLRFKITAVR